jgi:hypothetical protein
VIFLHYGTTVLGERFPLPCFSSYVCMPIVVHGHSNHIRASYRRHSPHLPMSLTGRNSDSAIRHPPHSPPSPTPISLWLPNGPAHSVYFFFNKSSGDSPTQAAAVLHFSTSKTHTR